MRQEIKGVDAKGREQEERGQDKEVGRHRFPLNGRHERNIQAPISKHQTNTKHQIPSTTLFGD
jgi:hypothetical protein